MKLFSISGYWKDNGTPLDAMAFEGSRQQLPDGIAEIETVYYGISQTDIEHSIETEGKDQLKFVITSYDREL
tara:strand:+ start:32 stop:247 length:216 start_codon:yes stop_codon:yes gene_type:complete